MVYAREKKVDKDDNCWISTRKDTTEEIRTKIKRKRPVCDAKSGKQKSFPLSLPQCCKSQILEDSTNNCIILQRKARSED